MKPKFGLALTLLLLASVALAGGGQPAKSLFHTVDCLPDVAAQQCGEVTVPLDHARPGQGLPLHLFVAVQTASEPTTPPSPPVFFLQGGPGAPATSMMRAMIRMFPHNDLVVMDGRGISHSRPPLDCPTSDLAACARTWRKQGIDPAFFNTVQAAQDLDAVRRALGYQQINLYSLSYGARLAQEVMRRYPRHLRAVVFDSPGPFTHNFVEMQAHVVERALLAVLDACDAQPGCRSEYPQLKARLAQTYPTLPVKARENLFRELWGGLMSPSTLDMVPAQVQAALNTREVRLADMPYQNSSINWAAFAAYLCNDDTSATTPERIRQRWRQSPLFGPTLADSGMFDDLFTSCAALGLAQVKPPAHTLVQSTVPSLLLDGEFDPRIDPAWLAEMAAGLPHSQRVIIAGQTHGVAWNPCGRTLIQKFLESPNRPLDASCAAAAQQGTIEFK